MDILRNGKFTIELANKDILQGLRHAKTNDRNKPAMVSMSRLVAQDNMLKTLATPTRIDTAVITDAFPYPQLFILKKLILVCGSTKIYEYNGTSLTLKHTASAAGSTWAVIDYYDYLYMSNESVVVIRDAMTNAYSESTAYPLSSAGCDYNGQAIIGTIA